MHRPERFLDKNRWAMDWYYPLLGGALRGHAAHAHRERMGHVRRRGTRRALRLRPTVDHRRRDVRSGDRARRDRAARRALDLFTWIQFLRHDDGGYWTGANFEHGFDGDGELFPVEQPTWNSAAVVLAANALGGNGPTSGLLRGEGLPGGLTADELIEAGAEIELERSSVRRPDDK